MAGLKLEGDFNDISDVQIQFIRDVIEKRGFKNNKVNFEAVGKAGDNYVAIVKRIIVELDNGKTFKMIAKIAPNDAAIRAIMNTEIMFKNETIMYLDVLPKFVDLQRSVDVAENEILRYAKCYGCLSQSPYEVILLEDLKELDFAMLDKQKSLNNESVKLVLKNFAILHSCSFELKKNDPKLYTSFKNSLQDTFATVDMEVSKMYFSQIDASLTAIMDSDKYKNAVRGSVVQTLDIGTKMQKFENNSKHSIIQQGDAWTNNILFKFQNDKAVQCIMIDYQLSKEANPVSDILYMIFNCTDYASRNRYFYEWIDYYHEELDKALQNFGMKANFMYPRDQLDADLKRYAKLYFGVHNLVYNFLARKPEEAEDIRTAMNDGDLSNFEGNTSISGLSTETTKLYKTKVEELVDSCREFGFL